MIKTIHCDITCKHKLLETIQRSISSELVCTLVYMQHKNECGRISRYKYVVISIIYYYIKKNQDVKIVL